MKEIKKYTDVIRYGKSNTAEILNEGDYISITEKLDGANGQFYLDEDETMGVACQSRKMKLNEENNLRGFYNWVRDNISIQKEKLNPRYRYFGEYLVSHKVKYKNEFYNNFYLFSIWDEEKEEYLSDNIVEYEAMKLGIKTVPYLYKGKFISYEHLMGLVGKSNMTLEPNTGEGIVVKNVNYRDRDGKQCFVKLVRKEFAEIQKQKLPKNPKLNDKETAIVNSIMTKPRVEKIMLKLVDEGIFTMEDFVIENMGKLIKTLSNIVLEDMIKEESEMLKNIEEKVLKKKVGKDLPNVIKRILKDYDK